MCQNCMCLAKEYPMGNHYSKSRDCSGIKPAGEAQSKSKYLVNAKFYEF